MESNKHTHKQGQTKAASTIIQNSVNSVAPAIMRREKNDYTYIHTAYN
jgi:hypothetical protein